MLFDSLDVGAASISLCCVYSATDKSYDGDEKA
jgi:hypothetical protein